MESNHPTGGLLRPAGFEDRMGHQTPAAPGPRVLCRAMRKLTIASAVLALLVAGCGSDDDGDSAADATTATTESQAATTPADAAGTTETAAPKGGEASEEDQAAIRETLVTWLLEGPCELMSDKFLEEQAFVGDNRRERCEFFRNAYQKPQYGEDDIVTSDYEVNGDEASAVVSDHISNVRTTFNLIRQDGKWVIDGTD